MQKGMSLLEVLVATAIVALLGVGIQGYNSQLNADIQRLQQRQLAQLTANNVLVDARLIGFASVKSAKGQARQMDYDFRWELEVSQLSELAIKRLDVEVFDAVEGQLVQRISGFIGNAE
ncbi:MAG: type II secretion system protein [Pseudomonadales bacterium]